MYGSNAVQCNDASAFPKLISENEKYIEWSYDIILRNKERAKEISEEISDCNAQMDMGRGIMAKRENTYINEAYKTCAIKAIRRIKTGQRLQQIYTIAKKMAESEGVDLFKSATPPDADDYRDEIEKLVGQIQDKERLIRVYSFVKKSHEIECEEDAEK